MISVGVEAPEVTATLRTLASHRRRVGLDAHNLIRYLGQQVGVVAERIAQDDERPAPLACSAARRTAARRISFLQLLVRLLIADQHTVKRVGQTADLIIRLFPWMRMFVGTALDLHRRFHPPVNRTQRLAGKKHLQHEGGHEA